MTEQFVGGPGLVELCQDVHLLKLLSAVPIDAPVRDLDL